jgi:hypothetical protein
MFFNVFQQIFTTLYKLLAFLFVSLKLVNNFEKAY